MAEYAEERGSAFDDRQEQIAATVGAHFGFAADHKALASIETDTTVSSAVQCSAAVQQCNLLPCLLSACSLSHTLSLYSQLWHVSPWMTGCVHAILVL